MPGGSPHHIGQGFIGLEAFRCLVNDRRFVGVPKIQETPKGKDLQEDRMNLATLRGFIR
jgi:deoxyribonuclease-4